MDVLLAFLGWLFGSIATIMIVIWTEWLRSPSLQLSFEAPASIPPYGNFHKNWRSLRIKVTNESLPRWVNRWMSRLPAQQCRAEIRFLRPDGTVFFDHVMKGRWAGTPEPRVMHVLQDTASLPVPILTNPQELRPTVDIYPGEAEILDVAARVDGEDDAYPWNDETYFYPDWRNPDRRLVRGTYLVEVTITSSGRKRRDHFRLTNDGPLTVFALSTPITAERQAVHEKSL